MSKKIEDDGGELKTIPNEKYEKFFAMFTEIEMLEVSQWKIAHLLGYFCKKYKEAYGVDYPWKFNNPSPKKCFEVWQMNTLVAKLSANPKLLKDYIDWAFDNLVPKAKRKLTSISFMTKDEVLNPYKVNVLLGDKKSLNVDRSTPLPDKYQQVFRDCQVHAHTYGDVAFLSQMDPIAENVATALDHIELLGFDMDILKRIV